MRVAIHPHGIEAAGRKSSPPRATRGLIELERQRQATRDELVVVPVEQRHIPLHDAVEASVMEGLCASIGEEERLQHQSRLLRKPTQQRRLILNRVADDVGQPERNLRLFSPGPVSHVRPIRPSV